MFQLCSGLSRCIHMLRSPWLRCLPKNWPIQERSHMPHSQLKIHCCKPSCSFFSVCCNSFAAVSENLSNRSTVGSFSAFGAIVDGQKPWCLLCKTEYCQLQRHSESRLEEQRKLEHLRQNWHWLQCRKVIQGSAGCKESQWETKSCVPYGMLSIPGRSFAETTEQVSSELFTGKGTGSIWFSKDGWFQLSRSQQKSFENHTEAHDRSW